MATQYDGEKDLSYDPTFFQERLTTHYRHFLSSFKKITLSFVWLNILFLSIFLLELTAFVVLFTLYTYAMILAISLGCLFLTCFFYFILLFYFQAKKPDQLISLKEDFFYSCKKVISIPEGDPDHHLSIAHAAMKLVAYFEDFEKNFYETSSSKLKKLSETLSTHAHWHDVFKIREMLLLTAIEEHIRLIRYTPTDIETHTSVASAYVSLSKLYLDYKHLLEEFPKRAKFQKLIYIFEQKFREAAELAAEEFKILNDYAPNDPWIHSQLAKSYHDLEMLEEEIKEYEIIIQLRPNDMEVLYRLGVLYFQQGLNAKGLKVYDQLCRANFKKAEDLISHYGSFHLEPTQEDL